MKYLFYSLLVTGFLTTQSIKSEDIKPKFDEDDGLSISLLVSLSQAANKSCEELDSTKVLNQQKNRVTNRIEIKYPGYTIDWNGLTLIEKTKP